ncbi:MAG: MBL fold metallo-hydrolase [Thermogutta sp.]
MEVLVLQSGSAGNCIYVESHGEAILLDAGISARQVQLRLAEHGKRLDAIQAVVISHSHRDHIAHVGVYQRKLRLPAFMTKDASQWVSDLDETLCQFFSPNEQLAFEHLTVEPICTPHDAPTPLAFVVSDGKHRLGVLTDLGHPFPELQRAFISVDAAILESNYDPVLLAKGDYPEWLQARIRGPKGHLSNQEAAMLVKQHGRHLQWICLAHLSQHNNTPEIAYQTYRKVVGRGEPLIADYFQPTPLPEIR